MFVFCNKDLVSAMEYLGVTFYYFDRTHFLLFRAKRLASVWVYHLLYDSENLIKIATFSPSAETEFMKI
jgi:hypothetical protein